MYFLEDEGAASLSGSVWKWTKSVLATFDGHYLTKAKSRPTAQSGVRAEVGGRARTTPSSPIAELLLGLVDVVAVTAAEHLHHFRNSACMRCGDQ